MDVSEALLGKGVELSGREGRLMVRANRRWGAVCNRNVSDISAAAVACRQLGFKGAAAARGGSYYGASLVPASLEILKCTGKEASLSDCTVTTAVNATDCNAAYGYGVWCQGGTCQPAGLHACMPPTCLIKLSALLATRLLALAPTLPTLPA